MNLFLDNAQRIFEVAQADVSGVHDQIAVMVRPDGGLHLVMETPFTLDAVASEAGAESAYLVTRSRDGVRVEGRRRGENCVIEKRNPLHELLRDRPLYMMTSPALGSGEGGGD